jgi:hypothetical protein
LEAFEAEEASFPFVFGGGGGKDVEESDQVAVADEVVESPLEGTSGCVHVFHHHHYFPHIHALSPLSLSLSLSIPFLSASVSQGSPHPRIVSLRLSLGYPNE